MQRIRMQKCSRILLAVVSCLLVKTAFAVKVHSVAAMIDYSELQEKLSNITKQSGVNDVLGDLKQVEDYHLSLVYVEVRPEDWDESIPAKIQSIVDTIIKTQDVILFFRRLAFLPGSFLAEYNGEQFTAIKKAIVDAIQKEIPRGVVGYPDEYFPHISLAYFDPTNISIPFDPQEGKPITTMLKGRELDQSAGLSSLKITPKSHVKISTEFWEADFIQD